MTLHVRDGASWKAPSAVYVRDGASWKAAVQAYVRDGSSWKPFLDGVPPDGPLILTASSTIVDLSPLAEDRYEVDGTFRVETTGSVVIEASENGGPHTPVATRNASPFSAFRLATRGTTVNFRLTPYSGANGTGSPGPEVLV